MPEFPSLEGQGMIAVDLETKDPEIKTRGSGAHRNDTFIAGVAIGTEAGFREYYPVAHERGENLPKEKVFKWLRRELKRKVPKVGANLGYDLGFLWVNDIRPEGPFYDVQIAEPLLDEARFNYSLEALSKDYLGIGKIDDELEIYINEHFGEKTKTGKTKKMINPKQHIWRCPGSVVRPYAIGDVNHPLEIFKKQKVKLEAEGLWDLFLLESKLIPMLVEMRQRGVRVDLKKAQKMYDDMTSRQDAGLAELKRISGVEVQPWMVDSIQAMFDNLGLHYPRTAKTNKPSFTATFLDNHDHPCTSLLRDVRKLDKMRGTFLQGCILEGHTKGRVHTQFNQLKGGDEGKGAISGRFSSSGPNLQFIPVRTDEGKKMREMFLPDEGQLWYKFDYSQIEYRLMAHDAGKLGLKGAEAVVREYCENEKADFHTIVAEMTGLNRNAAKTVNFGIAYGEGVDKLCHSLGLSREDGEALLAEYHRRAPFMKPLTRVAIGMANRGIVETLLGRKRRFDAWQKKNWKTGETLILRYRFPGATRAFTHKALNARIQGSAADIMKKSMVDVYESGVCDVLGIPQLTVHDELDGSFENNKAGREALREMKHIMENTVKLIVPLRVDGGTGKNWGTCE